MAKKKYYQVREALIELISNRRLAGNKLPPEETLAKQFGVSRGTIREVIQTMAADGIISKKHGMGNYVHRSALETKMRIDTIQDFNALIRNGGYHPAMVNNRESDPVIIDDEFFANVASLLHVDRKEDLLTLQNIYQADNTPAIYSLVVYPKHNVVNNPQASPAQNLFEFMEDVCEQSIDQTIIRFLPIAASRIQSQMLELEEETPLILWEEHYYNFYDEVICASRTYFHPAYMNLTMLRKAEDSTAEE